MVIGLAFLAVGRTTGSGWMIVLCSGLTALLLVGVAWPAVALRRLAVEVIAPRDGTVGRPLAVGLSLGGHRRSGLIVRLLDPRSAWARADIPARGDLLTVPDRRGVLTAVVVEARSAAPLGLACWRRRLTVSLAQSLEVGPAPADVPFPRAALAGTSGADPQPRARAGADLVRGVREYVAGDPARLVHWPATARRGELMVKELEDPDRPQLAIVVDLRGPREVGELLASQAAGLAGAALRAGLPVTLLTAERPHGAGRDRLGGGLGPASGVAGPVATAVEAGRRLARAVAAAPAEGPVPAGAVVIRVAAGAPGGEPAWASGSAQGGAQGRAPRGAQDGAPGAEPARRPPGR